MSSLPAGTRRTASSISKRTPKIPVELATPQSTSLETRRTRAATIMRSTLILGRSAMLSTDRMIRLRRSRSCSTSDSAADSSFRFWLERSELGYHCIHDGSKDEQMDHSLSQKSISAQKGDFVDIMIIIVSTRFLFFLLSKKVRL